MEYCLHLSDLVSFLVLRRIDEGLDGNNFSGVFVVETTADEWAAHEITLGSPQSTHLHASFFVVVEGSAYRWNHILFGLHIGPFAWSCDVDLGDGVSLLNDSLKREIR